jgi:hypothetical protein
MKLVRLKKMDIVQVEKRYVKNLNAGNRIQNICLMDSQILMSMEKRG